MRTDHDQRRGRRNRRNLDARSNFSACSASSALNVWALNHSIHAAGNRSHLSEHYLESAMSPLRLCIASILLAFTTACGSASSATSPTPAPSPAPAPTPAPAPAPAPAPTPSAPVSIPIGAAGLTNTAFNPDIADVAVGTTVTWTNADSIPHTSTSNQAGWDSGTVQPGGRFSFTFQTAGTFSYHCAI